MDRFSIWNGWPSTIRDIFYSLNYIAQPIAVMGESRNLWSQRLGAEWSTRHHRLNIPLLDLEGPTRDFLEAL